MSVGITRDEYNAIIGEYEATIKALRTRVEEAEKELAYQKERYELQVLGSSTEISDLRGLLENHRQQYANKCFENIILSKKLSAIKGEH